jgi:hypothetical protein
MVFVILISYLSLRLLLQEAENQIL